jgi:predicted nucleic acid-binding protein
VILVDSSVWIQHLREPDRTLQRLLEADEVSVHPFIVGELACGRIANRAELLAQLQKLPGVPRATEPEALELIERHQLMARGIGYIDVHLLASAKLADDTRVWTHDARLAWAASRLFVSYSP